MFLVSTPLCMEMQHLIPDKCLMIGFYIVSNLSKKSKRKKKVLSGCIYFSVLYFYKQINICFVERPYLKYRTEWVVTLFISVILSIVDALNTDKSHRYLRIVVIAIIYTDNLLQIWYTNFLLDVSLYMKVIVVSKWAVMFIGDVILSINWTQTKFDCWGGGGVNLYNCGWILLFQICKMLFINLESSIVISIVLLLL